MQLKNITTGEMSPAHLIGTSEDGRKMYQFVEGWEPVLSGGESDCVECDSDGNYLVGVADGDDSLVCGCQIQHDNSGVGHNWRNISREDLPANIVQEIECEIIDGGKDECGDYVASNGLHYRW